MVLGIFRGIFRERKKIARRFFFYFQTVTINPDYLLRNTLRRIAIAGVSLAKILANGAPSNRDLTRVTYKLRLALRSSTNRGLYIIYASSSEKIGATLQNVSDNEALGNRQIA